MGLPPGEHSFMPEQRLPGAAIPDLGFSWTFVGFPKTLFAR